MQLQGKTIRQLEINGFIGTLTMQGVFFALYACNAGPLDATDIA